MRIYGYFSAAETAGHPLGKGSGSVLLILKYTPGFSQR
jgi:hypothetical protein